MLVYPHLQIELEYLAESKQYNHLKIWFKNWNSEDELIDKVLLWGHFFLSHYLRDSSPPFHRELIKDWFSAKNEYTAAPRGFSKTTINQLCMAFSCANKLDTFIVVIEKTFTEAAEVIKGVHDEFIDNELILLVYGNLLKKSREEELTGKRKSVKNAEARGDVFINGMRIRGKGFNKGIRGLKSRQWRPSTIIMDDVEEDEHINNPEQRLKYKNNYNKGIQPAIDTKGTIKVFGTILHSDSLLNNLIIQHKGKIFKAHDGSDPDTASEDSFLWPSRWPREALIQKRKDMTDDGQSTSAYAQEYLNDPISDDERKFKFHWLWEMIQDPHDPEKEYRVPVQRITMEEFEKIRKKTTLNGFAMIDIADTTTAGADWTGVVVIFVAPNGARFRVDVRREKRNVKGAIDLIFEVWEKWSPYGLIKIGIEKKGFDDQIQPLFDEEKERRVGIYPVIEELKPMGRNKENRILGALQGFYETGKFISVGTMRNGYFVPVGDTDKLLGELYDHPSAKNDDLSDAESYLKDIVVIPLDQPKGPVPHHDPTEDPFENDVNPINNINDNFVGNFDDPDAY